MASRREVATRRLALAPAGVRRGDTDESRTLLCAWLEGAPDEFEVVEETVGSGNFGRVLTVLTPGELPDYGNGNHLDGDHDQHRTGDWNMPSGATG